MRSLCHQYVIRYYDNFEDNDGNVCIIMEYAENGELERYLNMRKNCNNPLS
jgi:serine/threonine protein kinase